ncbi:MAG: hypothetical protein KDC52_19395, partial [Ignavibacteriae bacterium]|nr:hypothetical protein [Ignavibacteriota bacterium]
MNKSLAKIVVLVTIITSIKIYSLPENIITLSQNSQKEILVAVDPQTHLDYGFAFPLTYKFSLPNNEMDITILKKYTYLENWDTVNTVQENEFFNHIEAVRIDKQNGEIFISVGFS